MMEHMNRNQIEQIVTTVLSTILQRQFETGAEITRKNTPNWDSLKHMEIMFALEDELNIEFSEEALAELDSADKIIDAVLIRHAT
jgi:acyl carrier protein